MTAQLVNLDSLGAHLEVPSSQRAHLYTYHVCIAIYCAGSLIALCMHSCHALLRLAFVVHSAGQAWHEATPSN